MNQLEQHIFMVEDNKWE